MIKQLLTASLGILLSMGTAMAQKPEVSLSAGFADPGQMICKLLLMENGNTLFFQFSPKNGIKTTVYNVQHQVVAVENNQISFFTERQLSRVYFRGLFELNGQATLFLVRYQKKSSTLYRFVFNSEAGKLKSETVVDDVARSPMIMGIKGIPDFYVKKDPASGYYAVASLNLQTGYANRQIKVTHYSPAHQVVHQVSYTSPEEQFKYLVLQDMYVHGGDYVFLTTVGFNFALSSKNAKVFVTRLSKGDERIKEKYIEFGPLRAEPLIVVKYNPANQLIYMLSAVGARTSWQESVMRTGEEEMLLKMHTINPATLELSPEAYITHPALTTYFKSNLKYKRRYTGVIQDFRLLPDGSVTILQEEMYGTKDTSSSLNARLGLSDAGNTQLQDIGIFRVNDAGQELPGSYAIAKSQYTDHYMHPYLIYRRPEIGWNYYTEVPLTGGYNDSYCSYDYLEAADKSYIIYNDFPTNVSKGTEDHRKKRAMLSFSNSNTVLAWFDGETVQQRFLFGEPEEQAARYSRIDMITHGTDDRSFVTLMVERKGNQKEAHIAWVKF